MALETITLVVDKSWSLISNASGQFEAEVVSGSAVASIGVSAPTAGQGSGRADRTYRYSALDGKVWMRAVGDSTATVVVTRVVDAGNVAAVTLPDATASAASFSSDLVAGADIATLNANLAGATVERISPADGRVVLSSDRTKLVRGLSAVTAGPLDVTVYTNHPSAAASPKGTKITLTVNVPPLTIMGSPPNAIPGQDYRWRPVIAGGNGRKTVSVTGRLAEGWAVNETNGEVTARANSVRLALGSVPVGNITVTDADGAQATLGGVNITISTGSNPIIVPPVSVLIDSLDTLNDAAGTARTAQGAAQNAVMSLDASRKVQGASAILLSQTTAANATLGINTANAGVHDPATLDVVAFYVDTPTDTAGRISNHTLNLSRNGNTAVYTVNDQAHPGGDWVACAVSEMTGAPAAFVAAGAGALGTSIRCGQYSPYGASFTADALIKFAKGIPTFVFTFDDVFLSQYTVAFPMFQAKNAVGTCYVPPTFWSKDAQRQSKAMSKEMYAAGWGMACDGNKTDVSVNADPSIAVADWQDVKQALLDEGMTRDVDHLCWPNGVNPLASAQALQDAGVKTMRTVLAGTNYTKHGFGKGRAKRLFSQGSTNTRTYDTDFKPYVDRAMLIGGTQWFHFHDIADSPSAIGVVTAELQKLLNRVCDERDAGRAVIMTPSQVFARDGFTTSLTF